MIHSTMLNNVDVYSWQACLYTLGKPGFQGLVAAVWWAHCPSWRLASTEDLGCPAWSRGPWRFPTGPARLRRAALWLERVLSYGQQCELPVAGWLFLPPGGRVLDAWSRSVDELGDANEAAVADDLSGRVIGVSGPSAMSASEVRLAFAVLPMPVSAARAGLTGAGRWDGDYMDTSLE